MLKEINNKLELWSCLKNEIKEEEKEIAFFENDNNNINNNKTNKGGVPLFSNINKSINNNGNEKILFSSNIPDKNDVKNKIEKKSLNIDNINKDKDNIYNKKEQVSLFCNIDRLNISKKSKSTINEKKTKNT